MKKNILTLIFLIPSLLLFGQKEDIVTNWTDGYVFYTVTNSNQTFYDFLGYDKKQGGFTFTLKHFKDNTFVITEKEDLTHTLPSIGAIGDTVKYLKLNKRRILLFYNSHGQLNNVLIMVIRDRFLTYFHTDVALVDIDSTLNGKFSIASSNLLIKRIIDSYSKDDLQLMKNEIYARKGYKFNDKTLKKYFRKQKWYKGRYNNVDDKLSELEKINLDLIKTYL